jgi:hypothetical protein
VQQTSQQILLKGVNQVIGASETNTVVSEKIRIHNPGRIVMDITAASGTYSAGITAKIQDSYDGLTWFTKGSAGNVALTSDTTFQINLLEQVAGDQAELPLKPHVRVVVTSGAGDAVTITSIWVAYEKA